jgi:hypothetical protein
MGPRRISHPVSGNGLGGPWAVAVDGNDNIWVSNFTSVTAGSIVQLCGVKTGQAISPPNGYVGAWAAGCSNWSISALGLPAMCG